MLYIWPYISFFSFPVLLPTLLPTLFALLPEKLVKAIPTTFKPRQSKETSLPRANTVMFTLAIAIAIVSFNTTVHPFTLADNRHYTFYVFRLLLRRRFTKYIIAPLYIFFAWATVNALGALGPESQIASAEMAGKIQDSFGARSDNDRDSKQGTRVSFIVLWLTTSALSLASTPLVEPRYFIVPWMIWRLNVPLSNLDRCAKKKDEGPNTIEGAQLTQGWRERLATELASSWALYLETLWLSIVNIATGYLFLYRGFSWPSEPGAVQRFMW